MWPIHNNNIIIIITPEIILRVLSFKSINTFVNLITNKTKITLEQMM